MSEPVSIDPVSVFNRMENWRTPIGDAFSALSTAQGVIARLSLGGGDFPAASVAYVNGVRSVQGATQAVARAATDADLGGPSSYDLVQASIEAAQRSAAERAEQIDKARNLAASFPSPEDSPEGPSVEKLEEINQFLEDNQDNPEALAAFYDAIPAANLLSFIADLGLEEGTTTIAVGDERNMEAQDEFLRLNGLSLGKGSTDGWLPEHYAQDLAEAANTGGGAGYYRNLNWALSELLQTGVYDSDFLISIADGVERRMWDYDIGHNTYALGTAEKPHVDVINSVMGAMVRAPDRRALEHFMYPNGYDDEDRVNELAERYWGETSEADRYDTLAKGFERLAIPAYAAGQADRVEAAGAATDAVQILGPIFDEHDVSTTARGSLATVLTYYWADVDALARAGSGNDVPADNKFPLSMGFADSLVTFNRDEVELALGGAMDLDDFDSDNAAIAGTPSGRIFRAMAQLNDYRNERSVYPHNTTPEAIELALKNNLNTTGFVMEAGFEDEIQDARDRDHRIENVRAFFVELTSTAAMVGGAAAGTAAAGPVGAAAVGDVTGELAAWGTEMAMDQWLPHPDGAAQTENSLCNSASDVVEVTKAAWASTIWDAPLPDQIRIEKDDLSIVDAEGNLITGTVATTRAMDAFGLDAGDVNSSFDGGRQRANPNETGYNLENCGS